MQSSKMRTITLLVCFLVLLLVAFIGFGDRPFSQAQAASSGLTPAQGSCPTDPYEPNNWFTEATPIQFNQEYNGNVCNSDDNDYFSFSLNAGQQVVLDLYGLELNSNLDLYGPDQQLIVSSNNAGAAPEQIVYTANVSGTYYAVVWGTEMELANYYTFRAQLTATPTPTPTPDLPEGVVVRFDPEGSFLGAITTSGTPGDVASDPQGQIFVKINQNHRIVQYNSEGQEVVSWEIDGEADAITVGPEGEVYVRINNNHRVAIFNPVGEWLGEIDTTLEASDIAAASDGSLFASFAAAQRMVRYNLAGEVIAEWETPGSPSLIAVTGSDWVAVKINNNHLSSQSRTQSPWLVVVYTDSGELISEIPLEVEPTGLAGNRNGDVFVALGEQFRILRFSAEGSLLSAWSTEQRPMRAVTDRAEGLWVIMEDGVPPVCADSYEPNDFFDQAWPIEWAQNIDSYICHDNDVDYFVLPFVEAGQMLRLDLDGVPEVNALRAQNLSADMSLTLYNALGEVVASSDLAGVAAEYILYEVQTAGQFVAEIKTQSPSVYLPAPYRLRVKTWVLPQAWVVNTTDDRDDGVCDVSHCSLREAIHAANASMITRKIEFNLLPSDPGYNAAGYWTIAVTSSLPALTSNRIFIDGASQAAFIGRDTNPYGPEVEINGSKAGAGAVGLHFQSNQNILREVSITGFEKYGLWFNGGSENGIVRNYIGLDPLGNIASNGVGVMLSNGAGRNVLSQNTISGNKSHGLVIDGQDSVINDINNNVIGLDPSGKEIARGNGGWGVVIRNRASGNKIGPNNVISGNKKGGVWIGDQGTQQNHVFTNRIGLDTTGSKEFGNLGNGVTLTKGTRGNIIGGPDDGDRNVISGNQENGVELSSMETTGNYILGNIIGLNQTGDKSIPNGAHGVYIDAAKENYIGSPTSHLPNVISGNTRSGIFIQSGMDNIIRANRIGVNEAADKALGNIEYGIELLEAYGTVVGGAFNMRNIISGNGWGGLFLRSSDFVTVTGNYIGVDLLGTKAIPNNGSGIYLRDSSNNLIGGLGHAEGNLISGNRGDGIEMEGNSDYNRIYGNLIGESLMTTRTPGGRHGLPNGGNGIYLYFGASGNQIGGAAMGAGNVIAHNDGAGVVVNDQLTYENTISRNSIYKNGGKGIALVNQGNDNMSAPTVTKIQSLGAGTYRLTGKTCAKCIVEVFTDRGNEGRNYQTTVVADASGSFTVTVSKSIFDVFTLTATNGDGSTSEFSTAALPDLQATGLEVTQAIQDVNHSVLLVEGKRTYVRGYAKAVSPYNEDVPGVTAKLEGRQSLDGGKTWQYLGELTPSNPGGTIVVRTNPQRAVRNHSFYFELPADWRKGQLRLTLTVDPSGQSADKDASNNRKEVVVKFQKVPPLHLELINVTHSFTKTVQVFPGITQQVWMTATASTTDLDMLESWLRAAYPISKLDVKRRTIKYNGPKNKPPSSDKAYKQVAQLRKQAIKAKSRSKYTVFYGMVGDCNGQCFMRGLGGSFVGVGPTGSDTWGWDNDGSYGDWYGGHEIGHALGRPHTRGSKPPVGQCGKEAGAVVQYPDARIGGPKKDPNRYMGWDIRSPRVYPPQWTDVMSYCSREWISDITYKKLAYKLQGFGTLIQTQATAPVQTLFIVGSVNLTQETAELGPGYLWMSDEAPSQPEPGDFVLRLEDEQGVALSETPFSVLRPDPPPEDEDEVVAFALEVLFPEGAKRVVLLYRSRELASLTVSAHAPTVQVLSPNGGETLDASFTVRWQASDVDGDALTYSVQYSADGGQTWLPLIAELTETEYTVDIHQLPGSERAMIRVLATDGANVGEDQSDAVFNIPKKAPSPRILAPEDGRWYVPTQTIILEGTAADLEDGTLPDDALRWTSDQDGELGVGASIAVTGLSSGYHTITLTATDSDGMEGATTITLYIADALSQQLYMPFVTGQ